jgi:hypothetical protein
MANAFGIGLTSDSGAIAMATTRTPAATNMGAIRRLPTAARGTEMSTDSATRQTPVTIQPTALGSSVTNPTTAAAAASPTRPTAAYRTSRLRMGGRPSHRTAAIPAATARAADAGRHQTRGTAP